MCVAGNVVEWSCAHVSQWVQSVGLTELATAFILSDITGDLLLFIDGPSLEQLGVLLPLDRVKILAKVKALAAGLCPFVSCYARFALSNSPFLMLFVSALISPSHNNSFLVIQCRVVHHKFGQEIDCLLPIRLSFALRALRFTELCISLNGSPVPRQAPPVYLQDMKSHHFSDASLRCAAQGACGATAT